MSRFLFVVWQGGGNVLPELALAKRVARRGHRVRVLGPPSLATRVSGGCELVAGDTIPEWQARRNFVIEEQIVDSTRYLCGPGWRDAVGVELERNPTDVVVCDQQLASAIDASSSLGVLTATVCIFLFQAWYRDWGAALLDGESTDDLQDRVALTLAVTPRDLDFDAGEVPPNVLYVGPVSDPDPVPPFVSPWPVENADPLVVVSFSTAYQRQESALGEVVDALAGLPVRSLVLAGEGLDVPVPAHVELRRWVPHAAVMPSAALCVTHGGVGTTMAALASGVPLLVMPHLYEQALNGYRVTQLGAGKLISAEAQAPEIAEVVLELLADRSYRLGAQRVTPWFEDGSDRAVKALEALADRA